jgi:hypothetical protein
MPKVLPGAETACAKLLPGARIEADGQVDISYSDHWWIGLEVRPTEHSGDAFELLGASFDHCQQQWDTGWDRAGYEPESD